MTRRRAPARERGLALIALLAVVAMGASWFIVSRLNAESNLLTAINRTRNAQILNQAKKALIGYVALRAATTPTDDPPNGEQNPGRLPCPEAASNVGTTNEGIVPGPPGAWSCSSIGRLPWRTLGIDKLIDAAGEPLWYVVGPNWRLADSAAANSLKINSNTTGDITVDGGTEKVVALIIAPGAAMNVAAATNCTAIVQSRSAPGPAMSAANYLECFNSATLEFWTTASSSSYNDQVIRITVADVMPAIEAAIAQRIEKEIVPQLKTAYNATNWGLTGTDKVYPYPATFANPDTSSFLGNSANTAGLLPFAANESSPNAGANTCTVALQGSRCVSNLVSWSNASPSISYTGVGVTLTSSCSYWGPTDFAQCNGTYTGTPTQITVSGPQSNGAMSLRQLRSATTAFVFWLDLTSFSFTTPTPTPSVTLNSDGTLTVSLSIAPPAPLGVAGVMYWIFVPGNATADHPLLDNRAAGTGSNISWFARNEWHKLTYYALAPGYAASGAAPRSCTSGTNCLSVTNVTPAGGQRAILILAGRSINGSARPSTATYPTPALYDYLEFGNAGGSYERRPVPVMLATTYVDAGALNAYSVSVASVVSGRTFQFKALTTNTGAATLATPATGAVALVNADGTALAASTVRANAVVQVVYDGAQFRLTKRPFNDRIVVVDSN